MSEEQAVASLREGYAAIGDPFLQARYLEWRAQEIARDPERKQELAGYDTIYSRLGGWKRASRLVIT